jgi:biotin transport system substrate-specific component
MQISAVSNSNIKIFLSVLLMIACAQISIPLKPVPITLHTVGVLLIGLTLSPREAFFALFTLIGLGIAGAPVFTGWSSGLSYFLGATGGYYVGFLVGAPAMAYLRQKFPSSSFFWILAICFVGQVSTYVFGVSWLALSLGWEKAITFGLMPFILPGVVKSMLLSVILKSIYVLKTR